MYYKCHFDVNNPDDAEFELFIPALPAESEYNNSNNNIDPNNNNKNNDIALEASRVPVSIGFNSNNNKTKINAVVQPGIIIIILSIK